MATRVDGVLQPRVKPKTTIDIFYFSAKNTVQEKEQRLVGSKLG